MNKNIHLSKKVILKKPFNIDNIKEKNIIEIINQK